MKTPAFLPLILLVLACNNKPSSKVVLAPSKQQTKQVLILDTTKVNISTIWTDTVLVTKAQIDHVLKFYPELTNKNEHFDPYTSYVKRGLESTIKHEDGDMIIDFSSEAGQDDYFLFYAYFLSQNNGLEKYKAQREKLVKLYTSIVATFIKMDNGGSIPNHQHARLIGVAENSVYLYKNGVEDRYKKQYNFAKQKSIYIKSLKQFIEDECSTNYDVSAEDKQKMFETVKEIDGLITQYFYLERALAFQYSN